MTWLAIGIAWMALGGYSVGGLKGMLISVGIVFALIMALFCIV